MKKSFISILIISIFILGFPLQFSLAQGIDQSSKAPETLEEGKAVGKKILNQLPGAIKKVWRKEALPFFQKMWDWLRPQIEPWWQKFLSLLGKEVEKRKPDIEKEFQKEAEEMQKELPKVGKSLWERFRELLK